MTFKCHITKSISISNRSASLLKQGSVRLVMITGGKKVYWKRKQQHSQVKSVEGYIGRTCNKILHSDEGSPKPKTGRKAGKSKSLGFII